MKVQIIIPTTTNDYLRMRDLVPERIFLYLPVKELIFIGNKELNEYVNNDIEKKYKGLKVKTLNEEEIIERQPVIDFFMERVSSIDEDLIPRVRPGWYYQQFLKMSFSNMSDGGYYVSWDMDTVPLRKLSFFDDCGRPFFDLKREHNPGYFLTIEKLLGISKNVEGSFISEHMIFDREYMKELLSAIEEAPVKGNNYMEKVINSIDDDYIGLGFSEFETYGTFVTERHAGAYGCRNFASFRRGSWFVKERDLSEEDMVWLSKDYDAISFENTEPVSDMVQLFRNPKYRMNMSARKFYETILESGYFGNYSGGRIDAGDWYAPV